MEKIVSWLQSIDGVTLLYVPLLVIFGGAAIGIEIHSWIKYHHSALF